MGFIAQENPLHLITGNSEADTEKFLELLTTALINGIKLVQIRAKSLSSDQYANLASAAVELCHQYQAKALMNGHMNLLSSSDADGIHLPSKDLMQLTHRPVSKEFLFSVACHNKEQILQAKLVQADFVLLSPVLATPSCPSDEPLGWEKFSEIARTVDIPVYALGGMTSEDLSIAKAHGAVGIAAIRSLWGRSLLTEGRTEFGK